MKALLATTLGCALLAGGAVLAGTPTPTTPAKKAAGERSKFGDPMAEMKVRDVISPPGTGGYVVLLQEKHGKRIVPIAIGPAEGLAISMRLARQKAPRPLTHDLIDKLLEALGARLVKVHVEDMREQVFLGRLYLMQGKRPLDIDSRPSDAMALAVGAGVPVWCSKKVIRETGIDLDHPDPGTPTEPGPAFPWDELLKKDDTL